MDSLPLLGHSKGDGATSHSCLYTYGDEGTKSTVTVGQLQLFTMQFLPPALSAAPSQ